MLPSVGRAEPQAAVGARRVAWECAGSSPVPPAELGHLAFEGAAGNEGNCLLVMVSCKELLSQ